MRIVCVIPARLNSSRLPKKILMMINGKSIIEHVYLRVKESRVDDIIIACDDETTLNFVNTFGAKGILTDKSHSSGTSRIASIIDGIDADLILNVQADEPMISPNSINSLIDNIDLKFAVSTLYTDLSNVEEVRDTNVVKTYLLDDNSALTFTRNEILTSKIPYKHIGVYLYNKQVLKMFSMLKMRHREISENLEQLRFLENDIPIKLVFTKDNSYGVNTLDEYNFVKSIMESI